MVERHWKGVTRSDEAENYIRHLETKTFPHLFGMAGFIRATILKRKVEKGVEFLVVTVWDTLDSIRQFTGDQLEVAVVPPEAQALMVEFDAVVRHYEVVGGVGPSAMWA